jgi:hypothetical protein
VTLDGIVIAARASVSHHHAATSVGPDHDAGETADVKASAEIERRQDLGGEIVKGRDRGDQARAAGAPAVRFNPSTRTAVAAISVGAPVRKCQPRLIPKLSANAFSS